MQKATVTIVHMQLITSCQQYLIITPILCCFLCGHPHKLSVWLSILYRILTRKQKVTEKPKLL